MGLNYKINCKTASAFSDRDLLKSVQKNKANMHIIFLHNNAPVLQTSKIVQNQPKKKKKRKTHKGFAWWKPDK